MDTNVSNTNAGVLDTFEVDLCNDRVSRISNETNGCLLPALARYDVGRLRFDGCESAALGTLLKHRSWDTRLAILSLI